MKSSSREQDTTKAVGRQVVAIVAEYFESISAALDRTLFLERIGRLAALIALWGVRFNLTAAPGDPDEIAFHFIDSLASLTCSDHYELLRDAFDDSKLVLDLGSGAGLPGLVLAAASPASFTLVESRRKRASFLKIAAAEMGLQNVVVESRRIEPDSRANNADSGFYGRFDVVTARGFGTAAVFYSAAAAALRSGGTAILYANPGQNLDLQEAEENGLHGFRRITYEVARGRQVVKRILGIWRRR
jgi:16S rRNA (guanine(527)-N(7))-methyltransferase RsmG